MITSAEETIFLCFSYFSEVTNLSVNNKLFFTFLKETKDCHLHIDCRAVVSNSRLRGQCWPTAASHWASD